MAKKVHAGFLTIALTMSAASAHAQSPPQQVPNMGQQITPLALPGWQFVGLNPGLPAPAQNWLVSNAVSSVVSPDHRTMLVLTSGYNRYFINNIQPPPASMRGMRRTRTSTYSSTTFRIRRRSRSR